jgi:transcriptional regulator with PAS, ATPase and Fis domain
MHITDEVYQALKRYRWPGNIRELENVMERAINITDDDSIRLEHLPRQVIQGSTVLTASAEDSSLESLKPGYNLKSTGYQLILSSLEKCDGNIKEAAELLGISRRTLYRKMDHYEIDYKKYR